MKNWAIGLAILIPVVCAAVIAQRYLAVRTELAETRTRVQQIEDQRDRIVALELQAEEATAQVTKLEADLEAAQSLIAANPPMPAPEAPVDTAPPAAPEAPAEDPAADDEEPSAMERAQRAQMDVFIGMIYDDLLAGWNLPDEALTRVRGYLSDAALEAQTAAMRAMGTGNMTAKEAQAQQDEIKDRLRDQLSKELNRDALAEWDAYDEVADESTYRILLDGQLTMLSPGLSEENRWAVRDVFAEELTTHLDAFNATDAVYNRDNFNQAQLDALNAGLARLATTLDADQYGQAERFVQQAANSFAQMSGN